jgi:alanine dehydrogenase
MPQEEMLEVAKKNKRLVIGIPREANPTESRIPLTPEAVEMLVSQGHEIIIEKDAGKQAHYTDRDYSEKGGLIVPTAQEVYKSEIILKVAPLLMKETEMLSENQIMISSLHLSNSAANTLGR